MKLAEKVIEEISGFKIIDESVLDNLEDEVKELDDKRGELLKHVEKDFETISLKQLEGYADSWGKRSLSARNAQWTQEDYLKKLKKRKPSDKTKELIANAEKYSRLLKEKADIIGITSVKLRLAADRKMKELARKNDK